MKTKKKRAFQEEFQYIHEEGYTILAQTPTSYDVREKSRNVQIRLELNEAFMDAFNHRFLCDAVLYSEWESCYQSKWIDIHRLFVQIEEMEHEICLDIMKRVESYRIIVGVDIDRSIPLNETKKEFLSPQGQNLLKDMMNWMIDYVKNDRSYRLFFLTSPLELRYTELAGELQSSITLD